MTELLNSPLEIQTMLKKAQDHTTCEYEVPVKGRLSEFLRTLAETVKGNGVNFVQSHFTLDSASKRKDFCCKVWKILQTRKEHELFWELFYLQKSWLQQNLWLRQRVHFYPKQTGDLDISLKLVEPEPHKLNIWEIKSDQILEVLRFETLKDVSKFINSGEIKSGFLSVRRWYLVNNDDCRVYMDVLDVDHEYYFVVGARCKPQLGHKLEEYLAPFLPLFDEVTPVPAVSKIAAYLRHVMNPTDFDDLWKTISASPLPQISLDIENPLPHAARALKRGREEEEEDDEDDDEE